MSEFFYHTLTGFSIAYFSDFSKVPSTHKTNSKKLRQNFSLTKDFFWKINQETTLFYYLCL